ncbi:hypothetical protein GMORB2_4029 [Geosmithia morbida]|uniref:Uncharacterized protein n=1 Tax=Geosmithia morbida TaxID=1094350 RepID=A0A9P4YYF3_9HYPO|nr:uncharacterized protein GMORB2_4029 [Geosmithia morbida]KAF4125190.1 hypothetical protein GMORB2_4029 [Geosmithia morbida]
MPATSAALGLRWATLGYAEPTRRAGIARDDSSAHYYRGTAILVCILGPG